MNPVEKKRRIISPVYLLLTLVLMWLTNRYFPIYQYAQPPFAYSGIILILFGIVMAAISAGMFKKAETGIEPFDEATTLVTRGFYRYAPRSIVRVGDPLQLRGRRGAFSRSCIWPEIPGL
jgi:protein-S-isoprenylcysteine O-methyltransferase Ste14